MKTKNLFAIQCGFLFALLSIPALQASAQNAGAQPRITQAVDESKLTLLKGNTHPLARAEFDRGPAPAGLPMERMLLVLKRSPAQETALAGLLSQQMDKTSPNFHKWLTPEQFGQQFGPSDQDIQIITSWLGSQGFQVANVSNGRALIEFSGNAGQVQQAFHTAIHSYVVNGEQHWANSSDPQIPTALTPVVAGISTLHNFVKKPHVRFSQLQGTGKTLPGKNPAITFSDNSHGVGPADFAQIYSVPNCFSTKTPQFCGDGVTIAVVGRSNINVTDVQNFRSLFFSSLATPPPFTSANIILDGPDPGNLGGGEEVEAVLDASWSGAVAPNATINLVVSETTETTDGVDLSEVFIIDNNLAPVMSESFGACEVLVGTAQANIESSLAKQAAAQGITFLASTGDTGAEGCDSTMETIATGPIGVSIPAALPWTLAVGGTEFNDIANPATFWSATNNPTTLASALSYIPENVWNQSCLAAQCGAANANIGAGGGGQSMLFSKPVWQTGVASIPAGNRAVPDVSLNASLAHDPTVLCVLDIQQTFNPPSSCVPNAQGGFSVIVVGGTSVSTPSFAGIIALVNQETHDRQGQAGFVLYKLAAGENFSSCNASSTPPPSTCIFNNVTVGNNAVPGETGFGTSTAKFQAGQGYNEATGFGSVNAATLLSNWANARSQASQTTLTIPTTSATHGTNVPIDIAVAPTSGTAIPTGDVALIANSPTQSGGITLATFSLTSGDVATTTDVLPGGTYAVTAHYEGDGTFLPSDSSPVAVNIGKESSKTQAEIVTMDPVTGQVINNNANTIPYGFAFYLLRVNVMSSSAGAPCSQNSLGESGCATGSVQVTDSGGSLGGTLNLNLNSLGIAEDQSIQLSVGSHSLIASYGGSSSFLISSGTDAVTVTQANTTTGLIANPTTVLSGGLVTLTATVNTQSDGAAPTGTVQFLNGSTPITGTVTLTPTAGSHTAPAFLTATLTTTLSALPGPRTNLWRTPNPPKIFAGILAYAIFVFLLFLKLAPRKKLRGAAYMALLFFAVAIVAGAGCGGGSSTKTHATTASLTAKYSGDTNYVSSSSSTVIVTIQ